MMYLDEVEYVQLRRSCVDQMRCAACRCIEGKVKESISLNFEKITEALEEAAHCLIVEGADIWPEYTRES